MIPPDRPRETPFPGPLRPQMVQAGRVRWHLGPRDGEEAAVASSAPRVPPGWPCGQCAVAWRTGTAERGPRGGRPACAGAGGQAPLETAPLPGSAVAVSRHQEQAQQGVKTHSCPSIASATSGRQSAESSALGREPASRALSRGCVGSRRRVLRRGDMSGAMSGAGVACSVAGMCRPSAEEFFCLGRSRDTGDAGAANLDGSHTPPPGHHMWPPFSSAASSGR